MYEKIKAWHDKGLWTDEMVQQAADKGIITQEQADVITGG